MKLVLPFETPSKKNSRVVDRRTGRSFPSKVYTAWHKEALAYVRQNYPAEALGSGPFRVSNYYAKKKPRDRRGGDSLIVEAIY